MIDRNLDRHKTGWTTAARERIEASKALEYLLDVANGDEANPKDSRIRTCFGLLNKRLPDLKAIEHTGELEHELTIKWK